MRKIVLLIAGFLLLAIPAAPAFAFPAAPSQEHPVHDETGTLSNKDIDAISKAAANRPSQPDAPQIVVVLIKTLDGKNDSEVAAEYGTKWGVGSKSHDNGIVILVAKNDKKMRIEVAGGASDRLTDSKSSNIINDIAIPKFKDNKWAEGLSESTKATREVVEYGEGLNDYNGFSAGILIIVITLLILIPAVIILFILSYLLISMIIRILKLRNRAKKSLEEMKLSFDESSANLREENNAKEMLETRINRLLVDLAGQAPRVAEVEKQALNKPIEELETETISMRSQVESKAAEIADSMIAAVAIKASKCKEKVDKNKTHIATLTSHLESYSSSDEGRRAIRLEVAAKLVRVALEKRNQAANDFHRAVSTMKNDGDSARKKKKKAQQRRRSSYGSASGIYGGYSSYGSGGSYSSSSSSSFSGGSDFSGGGASGSW